MENMKSGYYWIEQDGDLFPARFDGEKWHGKKHDGKHKVVDPVEIQFSSGSVCQTGCTCTQNADGSWTINC